MNPPIIVIMYPIMGKMLNVKSSFVLVIILIAVQLIIYDEQLFIKRNVYAIKQPCLFISMFSQLIAPPKIIMKIRVSTNT